MQEICTPGSAWGDGYKEPCRLGEATDSKGQQRRGSAKATAPRPIPTSHSIDQEKLMMLVKERISDRRILKLLWKWLRTGVMEDGTVRETLAGTPQGGVITAGKHLSELSGPCMGVQV